MRKKMKPKYLGWSWEEHEEGEGDKTIWKVRFPSGFKAYLPFKDEDAVKKFIDKMEKDIKDKKVK